MAWNVRTDINNRLCRENGRRIKRNSPPIKCPKDERQVLLGNCTNLLLSLTTDAFQYRRSVNHIARMNPLSSARKRLPEDRISDHPKWGTLTDMGLDHYVSLPCGIHNPWASFTLNPVSFFFKQEFAAADIEDINVSYRDFYSDSQPDEGEVREGLVHPKDARKLIALDVKHLHNGDIWRYWAKTKENQRETDPRKTSGKTIVYNVFDQVDPSKVLAVIYPKRMLRSDDGFVENFSNDPDHEHLHNIIPKSAKWFYFDLGPDPIESLMRASRYVCQEWLKHGELPLVLPKQSTRLKQLLSFFRRSPDNG